MTQQRTFPENVSPATIPEAAIVAGAKAMDAHWGGRYAPDEVEELRGEITAIIRAVTPILKAPAWDEGYASGHSRAMRMMSDEPKVAPGTNPYRGQP